MLNLLKTVAVDGIHVARFLGWDIGSICTQVSSITFYLRVV